MAETVPASCLPVCACPPCCPTHNAVPDRFCPALRLCISDVLSLTRQVDSSSPLSPGSA